ncbi:MAG: chorismate mutase [Chloroflexi bacterium]|nr:chorismate mutase [Chloroflexota bacterium]MDA1239637.1 chorismate mutase [Chloroflexota bacterium]MQC47694.1 chorismate mutase [Chloroflexota bacterium]
MLVRGIRGATTVASNSREEILAATHELLSRIVEANEVDPDLVASILFSTTPDLTAEFPAVAAREQGYVHVALECVHEMNVPGSLAKCLRILMHVNTDRPLDQIKHIYLHGARALRRDLADDEE